MDAGIGANKQLLLDNIAIKRQALGDFEGAVGLRNSALTAADQNVGLARGAQGQAYADTTGFNITNKIAADEFNATGTQVSDQFNADQQGKEIAARVGAVATGVELTAAERAAAQTKKQREEYLAFLAQQDAAKLEAAKGLFS